MRVHLAILLLVAPAYLSGCSQDDPLTQLVVVVDSDLRVPADLDSVTVTVQAPSGGTFEETAALGGAGGLALPVTLGLRHEGGALGPVHVLARGRSEGRLVVAQSARTSFIEGESLLLRLVLSRRCRSVTCSAGETCRDGSCEDETVLAEDLPRFVDVPPAIDGGMVQLDGGPDAPPPDANTCAAECADENPCTIDGCTERMCTHEEIPGCCVADDECDDGELCTADTCDLAHVCQHEPIRGCCETVADCDDGRDCTRDLCASGACRNPVTPGCCEEDIECNDGMACTTDSCTSGSCVHTPIADCCVRDSDCLDSDWCSIDSCDLPTRSCVRIPRPCSDGTPCTDDMCDTRTATCLHFSNTDPCDDGVYCNGADTCMAGVCRMHAGDPCGPTTLCDEPTSMCEPCGATGEPCCAGDVCESPLSCTAGTCG
jgi:hypothetical protein